MRLYHSMVNVVLEDIQFPPPPPKKRGILSFEPISHQWKFQSTYIIYINLYTDCELCHLENKVNLPRHLSYTYQIGNIGHCICTLYTFIGVKTLHTYVLTGKESYYLYK